MKKGVTSKNDRLVYSHRISGWSILLLITTLAACSDNATSGPVTTTSNRTVVATAVPTITTKLPPTATAVPLPTPTSTPLPPTAAPVPKPAEPLAVIIIMDFHPVATGSQDEVLQAFGDLPARLEKIPDLKLAVSINGSLLSQSEQPRLNQPAQYSALLVKNAALLTAEDKLFMLTHFFEVSDSQLVRFPRFVDLKRKRGDKIDSASLSQILPYFREADWRDLQVMYGLAQLPVEALQAEPVRSIVPKLVDFSEQDKAAILGIQTQQNREGPVRYQTVLKSGQVELLTSPYGYLPASLLVNTEAARPLIDPKASLPQKTFAFPADLQGQLQISQDSLKNGYGLSASGFIPPFGAIPAAGVAAFQAAGANWLISDETVLAGSLDQPAFQRDKNDLLKAANQLYQPYVFNQTGKPVSIFFEDHALADRLAKGYTGKIPAEAAQDFVTRLKAIKTELAAEQVADSAPRVVTLVLDGATAFSGQSDKGEALLAELTRQLTAEKSLKLTTPSDYLKQHPATNQLNHLANGGWVISFDPWIGSTGKNKAWNYLTQVRQLLDPYLRGSKLTDKSKLAKATEYLYQAESGTIFQAYDGPDLGAASQADLLFRAALANSLKAVGEAVPDYLNAAIAPVIALSPARLPVDQISPTIDGRTREIDWQDAGLYLARGSADNGNNTSIAASPRAAGPITATPTAPVAVVSDPSGKPGLLGATYYGWDNKNIYFRLDTTKTWLAIGPQTTVSFYLSSPHQKDEGRLNFYGRNSEPARSALGFGAGYEVQVQIDARKPGAIANLSVSLGNGSWQILQQQVEPVVATGQILQLAVPWKVLPELEPGDKVFFTAILSKGGSDLQQVPYNGAGWLEAPYSLNISQILAVKDKEGDDHGSGEYTYPVNNRLYKPGSFDLTNFAVAVDSARNLVFSLRIAGTLDNPFNAPQGFSLQTFDIYVHNPGSNQPDSTVLLPGRNARLAANEPWNYAIVAEGWEPQVYIVGKNRQPVKIDIALKFQISPDKHTLIIKMPLASLDSSDAENWSYLPVVLGTDTQPSQGVLRVKDVEIAATADKFGGAPASPSDGNHTRIIDLIGPATQASQETLLSNYRSEAETNPARIDATSLAVLYMLRPSRR